MGARRTYAVYFRKLPSSRCYAAFDINTVTYSFRDIRGQNFGFFGAFWGYTPKGEKTFPGPISSIVHLQCAAV